MSRPRKTVILTKMNTAMNQRENPYNAVDITAFNNVIAANEKPVVVFFWAAWCGPCLMMRQVIEEIIAKNNPDFDTVSVDVDENPNLANRYEVRTIPRFLIFRDGQPIPMERAIIGAMSKASLLEAIRSNIRP